MQVMAAGVNYNNVWACLGQPVSVFRYTGHDFHIGGSDASGIVAAVGPGVTRWKPGDEVVVHCNQSCGECPECNGLDPMACSQQKIWALRVQLGLVRRLLPRAGAAAAAEAGAPDLGRGGVLRPRLLHGVPHARRPGRPGGGRTTCSCGAPAAGSARWRSSSAGSTAPTRSRSSRARTRPTSAAAWARTRSSTGATSRSPTTTGEPNLDEVKRFGKAIREATGGVDCDIVFEHVGSATFFTSVFVCRTFGKIVTCGATSGFSLTFDVRYLWMRQKTIIGSHFANAYQAYRANQLIARAQDPARALAHVPVRGVPGAAPDDARERAPREDGRARRRRGVSERRHTTSGIEVLPVYGPGRRGRPRAHRRRRAPIPFTRGLRDGRLPHAAVDDPPVRRLRHAGRGQRALPLPARAGPAGPLGRIRPADADGARLRRPSRARRGRARRASRSTRSTTSRRSSTASRSTGCRPR